MFRASLEVLGWESALETHRPFLSYSQLSEIVEKGPSARFDAMAAGLGLEALTEARERLRSRRLDDQRTLTTAREALGVLLGELEALDDERANSVRAALTKKPWDPDAVYLVLEGGFDDDGDRPLDLLRRLAAVEFPSAEEVETHCRKLRDIHAKLQQIKGSNWMRVQRLSDALAAALRVHAQEGDQPCPVCQAGRLDKGWRSAALERLERLRAEAIQAYDVDDELIWLLEDYATLPSDPPDGLADAGRVGIDASEVIQAWNWWSEAITDDPGLSWVRRQNIEPGFLAYTDSGGVRRARIESWFTDLMKAHGIKWEDIAPEFSKLIAARGTSWKDIAPELSELMRARRVEWEHIESEISRHMEAQRFFLSNADPSDDVMTLTDRSLLEIAGRLTERGAAVRAALEPLRERARAELDRRENLWRPLA